MDLIYFKIVSRTYNPNTDDEIPLDTKVTITGVIAIIIYLVTLCILS